MGDYIGPPRVNSGSKIIYFHYLQESLFSFIKYSLPVVLAKEGGGGGGKGRGRGRGGGNCGISGSCYGGIGGGKGMRWLWW